VTWLAELKAKNKPATVLTRGSQNEPKSANSENSEVRAWVPVVVDSRGGEGREKRYKKAMA